MLILFCDIDGTITNKYTHSFEGADEYIQNLIGRGISLILTSSKTFPEILQIQKTLGISETFIFENGSAIAIPINSILTITSQFKHFQQKNYVIFPLVPDDLNVYSWTQQINELYKDQFITITSGDPVKLTSITGLNIESLKLAQQRKYSETFLFSDVTKISVDQLNESLKVKNGHAEEGSRFITVTYAGVSKGNAIKQVVQFYKQMQIKITTGSIGDGKNDFTMFRETDICYFLTDNHAPVNDTFPCHIISPSGPQGFIKACELLLKNNMNI